MEKREIIKLIFKRTIKDDLKCIKLWKEMGKMSINNKHYITINIDDDVLKKKYNLESNYLELEYMINKNSISYYDKSTMYDIDEKSLLNLCKNNGYRIIESYNKKIDDYIFIVKKIREAGFDIIPLDYKILIKTEGDIDIDIEDKFNIKSHEIIINEKMDK